MRQFLVLALTAGIAFPIVACNSNKKTSVNVEPDIAVEKNIRSLGLRGFDIKAENDFSWYWLKLTIKFW